MIVLGFLLFVIAVVVIVLGAWGGGADARLDIGIFAFNVDLATVFFTGLVTGLVALVGLGLMKRGLRKSRENRRDLKQLEKMRAEAKKETPRDDQAAPAPSSDSASA